MRLHDQYRIVIEARQDHADGRRTDVWICCETPHGMQRRICHVCGEPRDSVRTPTLSYPFDLERIREDRYVKAHVLITATLMAEEQ